MFVICVMILHILGVISGLCTVKKFESYLQNLSYTSMFDTNDMNAHKLWFVLLSVCISFGYFIFGAETLIELSKGVDMLCRLKYICMNFAVAILIMQYNYFLLKDRRTKTSV